MSMINRMLKDLDKRHGLDGEAQVVADGVSLSFRKAPNRLPWMLGALALVALAVAVYLGSRGPSSAPAVQPAPATQVVAQQPVAAAPVVAAAPQAVATAEPGPTSKVVAQAGTSTANPPPVILAGDQGAKVVPAATKATEPVRVAAAVEPAATQPAAPVVMPPASPKPTTPTPVTPVVAKPAVPTAPTAQTTPTAQTSPSGDTAKQAAGDPGTAKVGGGPVAERPAPIKFVSRQQRAQNAFNRAVGLLQQGRDAEAQSALEEALSADPRHVEARQLLSTVWVQAGRVPEATGMLLEGLRGAPTHPGLRTTLARIHIANGRNAEALSILERMPMADPLDGEYHALLAGLYQSGKRHAEAVNHFLAALNEDPSNPQWLIGAGISLRASGQPRTAAEAFQRALDSGALAPEVAHFAAQQLRQLGAAR